MKNFPYIQDGDGNRANGLIPCIVRHCNILHSQDVVLGHFGKMGVYADHYIVSLSTSREVDNDLCPLVRDSEPIRLLEIPTSPSLYMLIQIMLGNVI